MSKEKSIWRSGAYWIPVLLSVWIAHAESFATYSISCDDMWADVDSHYMLLRQGRLAGELFTMIRFPNGSIPQPFWNVAGFAVYAFALAVLCDFWKQIGREKISNISLGFFTALFISCPLTHELLTYASSLGSPWYIGISLLLCFSAIRLCWAFCIKKDIKLFLGSVLCMLLLVGIYEAYVPLYICAVIGTFWLFWEWDGKKDGIRKQFSKAVPYIIVLILGVVLNAFVSNAVSVLVEGRLVEQANRPNSVLWHSDTFGTQLHEMIKTLVLQYGVFAFEHLPITLMWIAFIACFIYALVETITSKKACPLFFFFGMTASVFLISFVMGHAVPYRAACWPIAFYTGFTGMLYITPPGIQKKALQKISLLCLSYFLYIQCAEMAYRIHVTELRWQEEKNVLSGIATQYQTEFDTGEPLVLVGRHKLSEIVFDADFMHKSTFVLPFLAKYYEGLHVYDHEKYYCRMTQTEALSVIEWAQEIGGEEGSEASGRALHELFKYCGYDIPIGTVKMTKAASSFQDTIPAWPKKGSMIDAGAYVVVNLGEGYEDGY